MGVRPYNRKDRPIRNIIIDMSSFNDTQQESAEQYLAIVGEQPEHVRDIVLVMVNGRFPIIDNDFDTILVSERRSIDRSLDVDKRIRFRDFFSDMNAERLADELGVTPTMVRRYFRLGQISAVRRTTRRGRLASRLELERFKVGM